MGKVAYFLFILLISLFGLCLSQTVAPVKITSAQFQSISETVSGHGIVEPEPEGDIKISAVAAMRIEKILIKPGDSVRKGQLLVKLQRDKALDVEVEKARIIMQQAKVNLDRAKKLYEKGVYPRVNYEQKQTEYNLAKADLDLKSKTLDFAIANSELRSSITGVVSSVTGKVGQIADPSLTIARIVNTEKMFAVVGIEVEDIDKVMVGQKVEIHIPNFPDAKPLTGIVEQKNKEIDPATQLVRIWIEVKNPDGLLQPGMFAVGLIFVKTEDRALVVPRSSVLKDDKGKYVFVVEKKVARKIQVKTGIENDGEIQILDGIHEGQQVVYEGNYELEDGMTVTVTQ